MKVPKPLTKGSLIAFAAPARWVEECDLEAAIRMFEQWGLRVKLPAGLFQRQGQLAGSDSHRAAVMQEFIDDNEVEAIVCVRGGYGTVRMVDRVDWDRLRQHPKWIVGYSDITVLHSHIHSRLGMPTIHAAMPIDIKDDAAYNQPAAATLRRLLFGEQLSYRFTADEKNRHGACVGEVVGGNLSVLYSLCGSPSTLDTRGKILLIEDLDEYRYHIDRMMVNLRRNGMLSELAGLIVGPFTQQHDNAVPFGRTAEETIADVVADCHFPVAFNAPFGHIGLQNEALMLGAKMRLEVNEHGATLQPSA